MQIFTIDLEHPIGANKIANDASHRSLTRISIKIILT